MIDIVERLRHLADNGVMRDTMHEAANEIEQLRIIVLQFRGDKQELQMEIKRLRANARTSAETIELLVKDVELLRKNLEDMNRINAGWERQYGEAVASRREPAATAESGQ